MLKGFQFLTLATRSPTRIAFEKRTLIAFPPSSSKSSTISGLVLSSDPISVKVCPFPTSSRYTKAAGPWPGAVAVATKKANHRQQLHRGK